MRMLYLFFFIVLFIACAEKNEIIELSKEEKEIKNIDEAKPVEQIKQNQEIKPLIGWLDQDTYTVKVTADSIDRAIDLAKHKILQDIVRVRVLNESRYTDITKVSAEFEKSLKDGKILLQNKTSSEIEIYFQIREQRLKEKFERK